MRKATHVTRDQACSRLGLKMRTLAKGENMARVRTGYTQSWLECLVPGCNFRVQVEGGSVKIRGTELAGHYRVHRKNVHPNYEGTTRFECVLDEGVAVNADSAASPSAQPPTGAADSH